MSTIIVIGGGGGGGGNQNLRTDGNHIVDANGQTVAVFTSPEDAIRYLRTLLGEEANGLQT